MKLPETSGAVMNDSGRSLAEAPGESGRRDMTHRVALKRGEALQSGVEKGGPGLIVTSVPQYLEGLSSLWGILPLGCLDVTLHCEVCIITL